MKDETDSADDADKQKLEAMLDQMKFIRGLVVERLMAARWLESAQFNDSTGMQSLRWSEDGIAKIRVVHSLLSELNYFAGANIPMHRRGEFDDLMNFFSTCISHHGPLESPKTPPPG